MQTYPLRQTRPALSLDGLWQFAFVSDDHTPLADVAIPADFNETQTVPGVFDTELAHHGRRGIGFYRREIALPFAMDADTRLLLRIGAIGLAARFWIDGILFGDSQLPYSSFELRLPSLDVTKATHTMVIAVDNRFVPKATPLFSPNFDFYAYGGIYRSLILEKLPAGPAIDRVQVTTLDVEKGDVRLRFHLQNTPDGDVAASFGFDYGQQQSVTLQVKDGQADLVATVPNARPWTCETPNLHTVMATVGSDTIVERFGIRIFATRGQDILVNGQPVKLLGACRHEANFDLGPAIPVNQMLADLKLLKGMGSNFIRCVHYPQDQQFLDLCDEVGIYVWQESMGWNDAEASIAQPQFAELQVEQTRLMVGNSFNHASIIIWGFMNECASHLPEYHDLYVRQAATIRSFDPTFLVSYACNRLGHNKDGILQDICFEVCDIVSFNIYPGWIGGPCTWNNTSSELIRPCFDQLAVDVDRHPGSAGKPLLMSENGCCGIYGMHDPGMAQWSEEYQADYVATAVKALLDNPRYNGFSIWQFIDSRSYVNAAPGVRCKPKGMNYAGLVDEYRRPKLAYYAVKELYTGAFAEK